MSKQILNDVLIEVWDAESGVDTYDKDYDNIDLRVTVYKANQDYPDIYKSEQLGVDEFSESMDKDMESAFGFTEWMTALYALTQYKFSSRINDFIIETIVQHEGITESMVRQAIAHEKNEIRKLEFAS